MQVKTINNVLVNKGNASYQCSPDFPYVVKSLNLLSKHSKVPNVTFAELEEALDIEEQGRKLIIMEKKKSEFLEDLYAKLLRCCRRTVKNGETNFALFKFVEEHLYYFKDDKNPFGHIRSESDASLLTSKEKLTILRALVDEKMELDGIEIFDTNYTPDQLRYEPLVDKKKRKFWYFGDTYLFLEREEKKKKLDEPNTSWVEDEGGSSQNQLPKFCIICKTSEDWSKLVEAYEMQNNSVDKELAEILKEKLPKIKNIEKNRLRALREILPGSRTSVRIQEKREAYKEKWEKRRKEEEQLDQMLGLRKMRKPGKDFHIKEGSIEGEMKSLTREERYFNRQLQWTKRFGIESEPGSSRNSMTPSEEGSQPKKQKLQEEVLGIKKVDKIAIDDENTDSYDTRSSSPFFVFRYE